MDSTLTPVKFIKTQAKNLPYHECFINSGWMSQGMATIFISKKMPNNSFIVGLFNVDTYCLGVKNTAYRYNINNQEYSRFYSLANRSTGGLVPCDINLAHNVIFGAIKYAENLGFKPHRVFSTTRYFLDENLIDGGINQIEFGQDGMPFYIAGPNDDTSKILARLDKKLGKGNYHYAVMKNPLV